MPLTPQQRAGIIAELKARGKDTSAYSLAGGAGGGGAAPGMPALQPNAPGAPYLPAGKRAPNPSSESGYKAIQDRYLKGAESAERANAESREMEGLLARQQTGGIYAVPFLGAAAGMFDPEIRRIDALSSASARSKRQPGEGAISDFDAKMFQQQAVGKGQPTTTNRMIIRAERIAQDQATQKQAMADWWHERYGTIDGFGEAWKIYRDANPIFDRRSEALGKPMLNANRQNWRQWAGDVRGAADAEPSVPIRDIQQEVRRNEKKGLGQSTKEVDYSAVSPAALKTARALSGTKEKSGTKGNPWLPTSREEMEKIPSGSFFINPADGRILPKR